jgi:hypothetical protein
MDVMCPEHDDTPIEFIAHYGAPGIGWHGRCPVDHRDWAVVGSQAHTPEDQAHILRLSDCI